MINTLKNHMATIFNPLFRTTNESYQQMNGILTRIGDTLAIPRKQLGNKHIIEKMPVQERPVNNNNLENKVNASTRLVNDKEQPNFVFGE